MAIHPGAVKWNDLQKGGGEMGKVNISDKLHNATHERGKKHTSPCEHYIYYGKPPWQTKDPNGGLSQATPRSPGLALRWKRRQLLFTRHAGNCIVHQTIVKTSDKQVSLVVEPPYIPQMSDIMYYIVCMLICLFIYMQ